VVKKVRFNFNPKQENIEKTQGKVRQIIKVGQGVSVSLSSQMFSVTFSFFAAYL